MEDLNKFLKVLTDIKLAIKNYKNLIEEASAIDYKHCETNIDFDILYKIIESSKEQNDNVKYAGSIIALYYGSPYLTLNLCIEAIKSNSKLIISIDDIMLRSKFCISYNNKQCFKKQQYKQYYRIL